MQIPRISESDRSIVERFLAKTPGFEEDLSDRILNYLVRDLEGTVNPKYYYVKPQVYEFAIQNKREFDVVFRHWLMLTKPLSPRLMFKAIFQRENDFFILQKEDIEDLRKENILHNPNQPDSVYLNAADDVRYAFIAHLPHELVYE